MTMIATNLGFPRIGRRRELKFALENFWSKKLDETGLLAAAAELRAAHWRLQAQAGIATPPSNDFSLYDHVLDTSCMLGAVPAGYGWAGGPVSLATYFALARGTPQHPAMEMTKWFDTNYHYLVPRLHAGQTFELTENRPLAMFREAAALGITTRPVLLGPISFLRLAKTTDGSDALKLLPALLPVYAQILAELKAAGVDWVQMDEPVLSLGLSRTTLDTFRTAYAELVPVAPKLLLASYFGKLAENLYTVLDLPVAGVHLDLVRGLGDFEAALETARPDLVLSLGLIDGRNVWRADLTAAAGLVAQAAAARGADRLMIAPSCSLLHVPIDLELEQGAKSSGIGSELATWLAFATQKLGEIATLARGLREGEGAIASELARNAAARRVRASHAEVHDKTVAARLAELTPAMERRHSPYAQRRIHQQARLNLPLAPTTTIGSFPQTAEVRAARAALTRGDLTAAGYDGLIESWTEEAVRWQEAADIDVLVHGEFERNDMVKYFGEQLRGYAFTAHGWVQSYGSRCVAPPIIWGDVSRPRPMTVRWSAYAQSLTDKPMKGMLTGPVTMLQWSFVRDDLPRETVCRQIALALRDEVCDLEEAGIPVIQIDEPAFREGLPLRQRDWPAYLRWAVACFGIASAGVRDETQIHTHMCYSEFNDIMADIAAMDADVISIETARSNMELLEAFAAPDAAYPNGIGPGVWDIHSPVVPSEAEMLRLLQLARARLQPEQIWVNPDCGLKTRGWAEVRPAIDAMVAAAKVFRASLMAELTA
jgi:5-methyltetrahydropteroyltriglutamate--homocysteine methyltransferase